MNKISESVIDQILVKLQEYSRSMERDHNITDCPTCKRYRKETVVIIQDNLRRELKSKAIKIIRRAR